MDTARAVSAGSGVTTRSRVRVLNLPTLAIAALILWLPVQTPLALIVFQYGHSQRLAWAMLLFKDVYAAVLIVWLFAITWRQIRLEWFDWAAILYMVMIVVYSIVPWLVGSNLGLAPLFASARELLMPVELYALGRLAILAGVDVSWLVRFFLWVAAIAAAFTVAVWALLPASFWGTTLDLVSFVRVVQGIPTALTIWDISIVAYFGGTGGEIFSRAVGPFTQPVGTAHYFVLPFILVVAFGFEAMRTWDKRRVALAAFMCAMLGLAVVVPISRGSWIAAGLAVVVCAFAYRRRALVGVALVLAAVVLVALPNSRSSIVATLSGTDASSADHASAVDLGVKTVLANPLGLGVGQSDQFGQTLASGDAAGAGIGENMYIELLVSAGPIGCLGFVAWVGGLLWLLLARIRRGPPAGWIVIGTAAAFVGYLATALVAAPLLRFTTSASVWMVVGLAVGMLLVSRSGEQPTASPEPAPAA